MSNSRPARFAMPFVSAALLVLATAATAVAAGGDRPVGSTDPGPPPPSTGDGATRINPDPSVINLRRQGWDHITVSANGKKLTVYFWMGIQECNGLGRVDTNWRHGRLNVRLWTGNPAGSEDLVCPEIAQLYKTVIHLDRPIIGGGLG